MTLYAAHPREAATSGENDDAARCLCGHARYWHSHGGEGDCEFSGDCTCTAFETSGAGNV